MDLTYMRRELADIRKRERKVVRTLKGKALRTIDMLTCNDDFKDNELLSLIYRIAHSASGVCGNSHEDWQKEIEKTYQSLKELK